MFQCSECIILLGGTISNHPWTPWCWIQVESSADHTESTAGLNPVANNGKHVAFYNGNWGVTGYCRFPSWSTPAALANTSGPAFPPLWLAQYCICCCQFFDQTIFVLVLAKHNGNAMNWYDMIDVNTTGMQWIYWYEMIYVLFDYVWFWPRTHQNHSIRNDSHWRCVCVCRHDFMPHDWANSYAVVYPKLSTVPTTASRGWHMQPPTTGRKLRHGHVTSSAPLKTVTMCNLQLSE